MVELKEADVNNLIDLVTRKTINDFNELDKEDELRSHIENIYENLNDEERSKNEYLFNQDSLETELKNFGLAKGFVYKENDNYFSDSEVEYQKLKDLHKNIIMYEYANEKNIIQDNNLNIEYLRNKKLFEEITSDDFYSNYDIEKIKKSAEDELYYPDFKKDIDYKLKEFKNLYEDNPKENRDYINQKIDDVYYGIYITKLDYSKKFNIDTELIDEIHKEYNLDDILNNIEQEKLNQKPELDFSIKKSIDDNSKEYEKYIEKYYDEKDEYAFSLAGNSLANKNLYSKISNHLDEKDITKDLQDQENIKRFSAKDDEKIKRLQQDKLYAKLLKQMKKNERFLNSTQSNIAYKARSNSENIARSTSQLNSRDSMNTQLQIDKTESNVRNTIQDTKTDNRIHRKKENRDNDLER